MTLRFENRSCSIDGTERLRPVSLTIIPRTLTVLVGPNGSGKTTLLRAGMEIEPSASGRTFVNGRDWRLLSRRERARSVSYISQKRELAWPLRVRDVVALGRFAYGSSPSRLSQMDEDAVRRAMAACALEGLEERPADTLSGGEEARLHCARALSAGTPFLLADEPVSALDPYHQHQVMQLFRRYTEDGGGALIVLHDLALAYAYADRVAVLVDGELVAEGTTRETLTTERIEATYGVPSRVRDGHLTVLPPAPCP